MSVNSELWWNTIIEKMYLKMLIAFGGHMLNTLCGELIFMAVSHLWIEDI